ncbi:hypothetical protein [Rhodococcus sp. (in: high G+C Gram-positive bacteria)]|uniref:hypothetical protein n=1 Tax=Rhodococcus sp. TaxID=1831 RepID=UPI003B8A8536
MLDRSDRPGHRPTRRVAGVVAALAALAMAAGGPGVASAADTGSAGSVDVSQARILTDGLYQVGVDVQPGTYTTAGAWPGSLIPCIWSRIDQLPGGGTVTIEGGNSFDPVTVTIEQGDDAFMTAGCRGWSRAGASGSVDAASSGGSLDFGSLGAGSLGS